MTNKNLWTSSERLYLDGEGRVVKADDPTRATLLVGAGGTIPLARAQQLGLVTVEQTVTENPVEEKDVEAPAETKDVKGPSARKSK